MRATAHSPFATYDIRQGKLAYSHNPELRYQDNLQGHATPLQVDMLYISCPARPKQRCTSAAQLHMHYFGLYLSLQQVGAFLGLRSAVATGNGDGTIG